MKDFIDDDDDEAVNMYPALKGTIHNLIRGNKGDIRMDDDSESDIEEVGFHELQREELHTARVGRMEDEMEEREGRLL